MKREFLKTIDGLTDEAIDKIMSENGKDIEKVKGDLTKAQGELKTANENLATLTGELDTLKQNGASVEEWQNKYETLVKQQEAEKAEREEAEKAKQLDSEFAERFRAIPVTSELHDGWAFDGALKNFRTLIESGEHKALSDEQIYHKAVEGQTGIYKNKVTAEVLKGGNPITQPNGEPTTLSQALHQKFNK